jgi:hypothetical protein
MHAQKSDPFNGFCLLTTWQFNDIVKYLNEASDGLKEKQKDFLVRFAILHNGSANMRPMDFRHNAMPTINPFLLAEKYNYEHKFFHYLIGSSLLTSYSLFESSMGQLCDIAKQSFEVKLSYKDIKGESTIHTLRKYLEKVVGINIPPLKDTESHWRSINTFRLIRNKIVHEMSRIDSNNGQDKALYNKMKTMRGISLLRDEFLINSNDLVVDFIISAQMYFQSSALGLSILWEKRHGGDPTATKL